MEEINYEVVLKRFFLRNNLKRVKAGILFIKIRADLRLGPAFWGVLQETIEKLFKFLHENKEKNPAYQFTLDNMILVGWKGHRHSN